MFFGEQVPALDGLDRLHRTVLRQVPDRVTKTARVIDEMDVSATAGAVHDALVGMVQSWMTRYPLVRGQGNWGSAWDDPPAEPRYTECCLAPAGVALLGGSFPALLANGAVGTNVWIPPHNVGELVSVLLRALDGASVGLRLAPDFPTGGVISGPLNAYETGHGEIEIRARVITDDRRVLVTEPPYMHPMIGESGSVSEQIIDAIQRDPSLGVGGFHLGDRGHLVIEPRGDAEELRERLDDLLVAVFPVRMNVMIDGEPRMLSLDQLIAAWIEYRRGAIGTRDALSDAAAIDERLRDELIAVRDRFADARRTTIVPS